MYTLQRTTASFCRTRRTNEFRYAFTAHFTSDSQHQVKVPHYLTEGLGDFLPPDAVQAIAVDYQQSLLTRLNEEVAETEHKGQSVAQTVISLGNEPKHVLAFNYASQALNNSFFFDNLAAPSGDGSEVTSHEHSLRPDLKMVIEDSFSSLDNLKSTMSAAALGMMGSGWVWLVCDEKAQNLAVVPSYGPGTMLVRNMEHRHPEGLNHLSMGPNLFQVLGESTAGGQSSRPAAQSLSPGKMPTTKKFHTSSLINSPLFATLLATPRFSQTAPNRALPEPLSPSNRYPQLPLTSSHRYNSTYREEKLRPEPANEQDPLDNDDLPLEHSPRELRPHTVSPENAALRDIRRDPTRTPFSVTSRLRGGQDDLSPLLCISVHEHMWLCGGHGITGKEEYLRRFWSFVDWGKVSNIYNIWSLVGKRGNPEYDRSSAPLMF